MWNIEIDIIALCLSGMSMLSLVLGCLFFVRNIPLWRTKNTLEMAVVRTMSSIYQRLTPKNKTMCSGKGCLLARYCEYFTESLSDTVVMDYCDVELRIGFLSLKKNL